MSQFLSPLRYAVFAIFAICNAIICSAAVWNLSIARTLGWNFQVDVYLIFVGSSGLALIFAIIFAEVARSNAILNMVWFECVWVGLFWTMELAGAAALTAIVPSHMCDPAVQILVDNSCSSTQLLLAFSWICTITLLGYFLLLVISVILHHKRDRRIWQHTVRNFPWSASCDHLSSEPPSPILPRITPKSSTVLAPTPRRAAPVAMYSHRAGLSLDYHIEYYKPPLPLTNQPAPPAAVAPMRNHPQRTRNATENYPGASFYPHYIQPSLISQPPRTLPPNRQQLPPSPPPLGDWPRADAVSQPLRIKRNNASQHMTVTPPSTEATVGVPRPRPSGPRRRSNSTGDNRPPPLDLSKITTFKERRR